MKKLMIALSAMLFVTSCNNVTELPQVTTSNFIVNDTAVIVGGDVTFIGGDNQTTRGICWSSHINTTTEDSWKLDIARGLGPFSLNLDQDIDSNKRIYYRAFAVNSLGTSYGEEKTMEIWENPKNAYVNNLGCIED